MQWLLISRWYYTVIRIILLLSWDWHCRVVKYSRYWRLWSWGWFVSRLIWRECIFVMSNLILWLLLRILYYSRVLYSMNHSSVYSQLITLRNCRSGWLRRVEWITLSINIVIIRDKTIHICKPEFSILAITFVSGLLVTYDSSYHIRVFDMEEFKKLTNLKKVLKSNNRMRILDLGGTTFAIVGNRLTIFEI